MLIWTVTAKGVSIIGTDVELLTKIEIAGSITALVKVGIEYRLISSASKLDKCTIE